MSIRQDIAINVDGVAASNAKLRQTQAELDKVGQSGRKADAGLKQAEQGGRSLKARWDDLTKPINTVSEGLGKVTFVGQTLATFLGAGLGGAVGGVIQVFGSLYTALTEDEKQMAANQRAVELLQKGFESFNGVIDEAITKTKALADARRAAANAAVAGLAGSLGATEGSLDLRSTVAARAQGGAGFDVAQERARLLAEYEAAQAGIDRLDARRADLQAKADKSTRDVAALMESGPIAGVSRQIDELILQQQAVEKQFNRLRQTATSDPFKGATSGGAGGGGAKPSTADLASAMDGRNAYMGYGGELSQRLADEDAARRAASDASAQEGRNAYMAYGGELSQKFADQEQAAKSFGTSVKSTFSDLASSATSAAGIFTDAATTITSSFGTLFTNLILSGEAGAKGFKKFIGEAVAGLSAQAFGYSILLGGLAAAAALSGPILGWGAPGLAKAAAVMAGTGTVLAVTARGLGAKGQSFGGSSSGGSGASSGSGSSGTLSGNNGFGAAAGAGAPQPINLYVGISPRHVHDMVVAEADSRSGRGRPVVQVRRAA